MISKLYSRCIFYNSFAYCQADITRRNHSIPNLPLLKLKKFWGKVPEQSEQGSMSYEEGHQGYDQYSYSEDEDSLDGNKESGHHHRKSGRYRDEVYSKRVPAGKRTYFFDVKSTRSGEDFFITITESKRVDEGRYEKHKLFLYKEDFGKFLSAMHEVVDYIKDECLPDYEFRSLPGESKDAAPRQNSVHEDDY